MTIENAPQVDLPTFGQARPRGPVRIDVKPNDYQPEVDPIAEAELQNSLAQEAATRDVKQPEVTNESQVTGAPSDLNSQIQTALSSGYSSDELKTYLQSTKGLSEDDADLAIVDSMKAKIIEAKKAGYDQDEVLNFLIDNNYDSNVINKSLQAAMVDDAYKALDYKPDYSEAEKAMDISDLYKNIYQKYSTTAKQLGGVFSSEMGIEARQEINQLNKAIVEKLKAEGLDSFIDNDSGEVMLRDKAGNVTEVDSSFLDGMWNSKGELSAAMTGGLGGASVGASVGSFAGPVGTGVGAVAGGLIGSAVGAAAGRGLDLAINSKKLSEDLTVKLYLTQMKQAAIFDGVATILGGAIFKLGAASGRGIIKAYKYATSGNSRGAYKALKENLNITDEQAQAMITNWEKLTGKTAPGETFEQKAIGTIAQTARGSETTVKSAAGTNERVSTMLKESIDSRAKALTKTIDTVADENVGMAVRKDLEAYQDDVKEFFGTVKKQATDAIDGTDFRFDLDKLAIKPVMDNIEKKLSNPTTREQFIGYASRIANTSEDRTFSGLVELRSAVNDFKYSKSLRPQDKEALNLVLNKIDGQINKAVKQYMPETGKQWTENFTKAKSEYSKMKVLEENALYKLVNRPGATEESIQKAISKYGNDKDVDSEVFNKVVERLAPATRAKVEGAAVKNLTKKFTFGEASESQAVHFPALADALKELNVTTPEAKNLINVVDEIAKVYKNDAELSNITGKTLAVRMQANLSSDIVQKAKYTVVGAAWNAVVKHLPGKNSRNLALIHQVSKLLENPLHATTAEELIKMVPKESQAEMSSLVKNLQIQTAKNGGAVPREVVRMYKQSKNGSLTATDGALGKGIYLVDKVLKPVADSKVVGQEVNLSKMATLENISQLVGRQVQAKDIRTIPGLQQQLIDKGYLGIKLDNRAMLFPETLVKKGKK